MYTRNLPRVSNADIPDWLTSGSAFPHERKGKSTRPSVRKRGTGGAEQEGRSTSDESVVNKFHVSSTPNESAYLWITLAYENEKFIVNKFYVAI